MTSVTRADVPLTPERLLQRYDLNTKIPEDQRQWQDATYVSGANTRRTPIGHYFHGYPVLYGLFGEASKAMGFRVTEVERLIMPSGNAYWALTKDGRYFDLLQRTWVDPTIVDRAKQEYDAILKHLETSTTFERHTIDLWQQVENTVSVKPSTCSANSNACVHPVSESMRSQNLEYPSDSQRCRPTYFMWWQTGFECDYSANRGYLPANLEISYAQDNDQKFYSNAYTGCGPTTLANMLWWWQTYKGHPGLLRPAISGYDSFGATQIELITDTNAYVDGIGRSATGGDVSEGLEKYFLRNYPALKSNAVMGWGATEAGRFHQVLVEQMSANNIVGIGHYVVNIAGHFGIMKQFTKIPFGGLTASLIRPPHPVFGNMNLSEFFSFSSVHWITRRY
ncbi:MAG: hypothetical protein HC933_11295 [Pleurocapsa sp. SU_196_0]|nr:hypothetical protein [Pleurocapsa sp. SU_196_0]